MSVYHILPLKGKPFPPQGVIFTTFTAGLVYSAQVMGGIAVRLHKDAAGRLTGHVYYAYNTLKSQRKAGGTMVNFRGMRFHDRAPVYQQIAEYLKRQILLGAVQDGDPMPSRRELAVQTGINPNTAQKAYSLMTEEGYVRTDGNTGSVVHLTPALRAAIDEEMTRGLVERFVAEAKANHLSYRKVIGLVSEVWGDDG